MIYGIGVDLVKMSRIRQALENFGERFQERVYTGLERDFCLSKANPTRYWAMRFAAKEAFSKAIGLGMRQGLRWRDIEVTANALGRPKSGCTAEPGRLPTRPVLRVFLNLDGRGRVCRGGSGAGIISAIIVQIRNPKFEARNKFK